MRRDGGQRVTCSMSLAEGCGACLMRRRQGGAAPSAASVRSGRWRVQYVLYACVAFRGSVRVPCLGKYSEPTRNWLGMSVSDMLRITVSAQWYQLEVELPESGTWYAGQL